MHWVKLQEHGSAEFINLEYGIRADRRAPDAAGTPGMWMLQDQGEPIELTGADAAKVRTRLEALASQQDQGRPPPNGGGHGRVEYSHPIGSAAGRTGAPADEDAEGGSLAAVAL